MNQFNYVTTNEVDTAFGTLLYILSHPFIIMWGGMVLHFIKGEIDKAEREARKAEWSLILTGKGVRVTFGVVSSLFAYVVTMPSPEALGVVSEDVMSMMRLYAFMLGFACESIADTMATKAASVGATGTKTP